MELSIRTSKSSRLDETLLIQCSHVSEDLNLVAIYLHVPFERALNRTIHVPPTLYGLTYLRNDRGVRWTVELVLGIYIMFVWRFVRLCRFCVVLCQNGIMLGVNFELVVPSCHLFSIFPSTLELTVGPDASEYGILLGATTLTSTTGQLGNVIKMFVRL